MDSFFCFFPGLWFLLVFGILFWGLVIGPGQDKTQIRAYLGQRRAQNITVEHRWFSGNKHQRTYEVNFQSARGIWHSTSCVMSAQLWGDRSIYWLDGPCIDDHHLTPPSSTSETAATDAMAYRNPLTAMSSSSKDKLISKLLDDNRRLRLELQRLQAADASSANTT